MAHAFRNRINLEKAHPRKDTLTNVQNYDSIRTELKSGDLLFFSGDHWVSGLIRGRSRSAWSHVGIVLEIEELNRVFLVECTLENGVRMIPASFVLSDYSGQNKPYNGRVAWARHCKLCISEEKLAKVKEFCLDNLTKQYDRREYWRILWRTFVGSKELYHDSKFTCSEFIYEAYKYAGIKLPKERGYFISPGAFWRQDDMTMMGVLI